MRIWLRDRMLDLVMRQMNPLRPETVGSASGEVLEVGFGTGLNLAYYGPGVKQVTALDPKIPDGMPAVDARIAEAPFPVERVGLPADGELPFDAGRFDCVVTTWTLCSIPDAASALAEMKRVLKPGGHYLFIEHGRAEKASTARWQDRLNPIWNRIGDGCNINRPISDIVARAGFELAELERFRADGPGLFAQMYRGVATRA